MAYFRHISARNRRGADFAVILEDDSLSPFIRAGQMAYLQRTERLDNGEIGLFRARDGLVFRQFCQDGRGTVYLFTLDRSRKKDDLEFPPGSDLPVCYGRVLLGRTPALPVD